MFELHHIGYLVRDIQTAANEFVARLGYLVDSPIIEDPIQTARVQFLRQPGDVHWLELVSPIGAQSKLSHALEQSEGLHHLCYEVADFEAAMGRLREQKMMLLGEPQPAAAFSGRMIVWFMDRKRLLVELLQAGTGELSLAGLRSAGKRRA